MLSFFFSFILFFSSDTSVAVSEKSVPAPGSKVTVSDTVRLLFGGDVTLAFRFEELIGDSIESVFENWNPVQKHDLFMVNLENPITTATTKVEKEWNFRMPAKYISILQRGGINAVTCANNHVFDYGIDGIVETMSALDSAGIVWVGIGKTLQEARTPKIVTIKGKRIALLGYAGWSFPATSTRPGVAPRTTDFVLEDVKRIKDSVDFVVVNFHWGVELAPVPGNGQKTLARRAIDAGADAIIGHHPHVLQGIEMYMGRPIAYSLGNFIFGGNSRHTYETALLYIELVNDAISVTLLPVTVKNYQPSVADDETKEKILKLVQQRSRQFRQTISYQ